MGHYDLYGNSYATRREAINAETAQCAEIDNDILQREMDDLKRRIPMDMPDPYEQIHHLQQHINNLEGRIAELESITKHLRPN